MKEIPKLSHIVFGLGAVLIFALLVSAGLTLRQPRGVVLPTTPMVADPFEPCDLDLEGDCDAQDYAIAAGVVGECQRGQRYIARADADHDGCITPSDLWQLYPAFTGSKYRGSPPQTFLSQAPCDIDWDGDCDQRDYSWARNAVGRCLNQVGYRRGADLDRDGCVSDRDFQSALPYFPPSVRGVKPGDEVTVRATVVENKVMSPVDGPDVLSVTVGGEPFAVVYHYGEYPPCLNQLAGQRARELKDGAVVEIFARVVRLAELSTCDAEWYYLKGL